MLLSDLLKDSTDSGSLGEILDWAGETACSSEGTVEEGRVLKLQIFNQVNMFLAYEIHKLYNLHCYIFSLMT